MSDYAQMLVAAGWIDPGLFDDDYQIYLMAAHGDQEDTMTYQE